MPYKKNIFFAWIALGHLYKDKCLHDYNKNFFATIKKMFLLGLLWDTFIKTIFSELSKKFLRNYKKNSSATIKKISSQL